MTISDVLLGLFGAAMTMIGWFVRIMWEAQQKLREDLNEIERQLPETYVRRDDFRDLISDIHSTLVRIEAKLDGKADKL